MYVVDNGSLTIEQYNLTTAWDTSTLVHDDNFTISDENQLRSLAFKYDGTKMYVTGNETEVIQQFTLSTPWDVTSATKDSTESSALTGKEDNPRSIQFNSDGTALYIAGDTNARMNKYTLSTAYDITTLSSTFSTFDLGSRVNDMRGFIFAANFTKLFVTSDKETAATTDKIHAVSYTHLTLPTKA